MIALRHPVVIVLAAAVVADLIAWIGFRVDKRRARVGARRIRERTLLWLAAPGGVGALLGMYAHRQRHKVHKPRFVIVAWLATAAQLAAIAYVGYRWR